MESHARKGRAITVRVICVCNQKGGTGKTTTAWAIVTGAAARGYKALAIDMEVQANLSYIMGASPKRANIYDVIKGRCGALDAIQQTETGDIIAAGIGLAAVNDARALNKAMQQLQGQYDYVVIDSPPTLTAMLTACICAADEIIIPVLADPMAEMALQQIKESIDRANPEANILGVLVTDYTGRTVLEKDMLANIRDLCRQLQLPCFETPIKRAVALQEAQFLHKSIYAYAPRSAATAGFIALLDAMGIREGGKGKKAGRRRK